jgi:uncharacterized damage-inducible protein DinB
MHPLEGMAGTGVWAAKNIAYNLDFIPDDKLNWKPAPTANSAMEIVNHVLGAVAWMTPMLQNGAPSDAPPEYEKATDRESAKRLLVQAAENYAAEVVKLNPADLGNIVKLPFADFPLARVASMPVIDLVHHHGQIAYIQTLLGDTESHFDVAAFR